MVRAEGPQYAQPQRLTLPRAALLAGLYALAVSIAAGTLLIVRARGAAGVPARTIEVLSWQAANYGLWAVVAAAGWLLLRRDGSGRAALLRLVALGGAGILLHALAGALLELRFSAQPPRPLLAVAAGRLPVDILVATAIGAGLLAAAAHARSAGLRQALAQARAASGRAASAIESLLVSTGSARVPVPVHAVEWLGAAGNYVVVNWDGREGLVRETLRSLEQQLDPAMFVRAHRSTIINLAMVASASSLSDGSWRLTMLSGAELVASRTYRDTILARLGRS